MVFLYYLFFFLLALFLIFSRNFFYSQQHIFHPPTARAAEICLTTLSDPSRSRIFLKRCLLENYEKKYLNLLNLIQSEEATEMERKEFFSVSTSTGKSRIDPESLSGNFQNYIGKVCEGKFYNIFTFVLFIFLS